MQQPLAKAHRYRQLQSMVHHPGGCCIAGLGWWKQNRRGNDRNERAGLAQPHSKSWEQSTGLDTASAGGEGWVLFEKEAVSKGLGVNISNVRTRHACSAINLDQSVAMTFNAFQKKADFEASTVGGLKALSCEVLFRQAHHLYNNALYLEGDFYKDESFICLRQVQVICKIIAEKLQEVNFLEPRMEQQFRALRQAVQAKNKKVTAFMKKQFEPAPDEPQSEEEEYFLSSVRTPKDEDFFDLGKITTKGIFQDMDHYPTDTELVVDGQSIKVHRHFLCMLSPVFQAFFSHDTRESMTGIIEIKDFKLPVVQLVVDYCYGRDVGNMPVADVIGILRFADKYDIKSVTNKLESYPSASLTIHKFCVVARYAWDLNKEDLKEDCCRFYRRKHAKLTLTRDFADLPMNVREDLLRCAIAFRQLYPDSDEEDD
uniref:BTB domain-containing protein n=1 Tax=Panagrellus redivivus TaxID=6233 RepID=A0A7E4ZU98_PANRE